MTLSHPFASIVLLSFILAACQPQPAPTLTPSTIPPTTSPSAVPSATVLPAAIPSATPGISPAASVYLEQALAILEQHALYRQEINWKRLKSRAFLLASNALTTADTYPAIAVALGSLNDGHSQFLTPQQAADLMSGARMAGLPEPAGRLLENGLAYVSVPSFAGSVEAGQAFALHIQNILREMDSSEPCGWIVDLRQNSGGDLWPMLAGIGPLLGEGLAGAFAGPDGSQEYWYYEHGQVRQGEEVLLQVDADLVYTLRSPLPPVAVLTGQETLSSGEALLVAFRGRLLARSFGRETGGLSTANERYILSDGAQMYLTVSRFADRTGQVYGGIIIPDEYIRDDSAERDIALEKASAWLLEQDSCMEVQK